VVQSNRTARYHNYAKEAQRTGGQHKETAIRIKTNQSAALKTNRIRTFG